MVIVPLRRFVAGQSTGPCASQHIAATSMASIPVVMVGVLDRGVAR
jgi:hypothetical protein